MQKALLSILFSALFLMAFGQDSPPKPFNLFVGAHFNQSNQEFMNTTGLGLFLEPSLIHAERFQFSYRFEASALVEGVLVLPGGCSEEHPRFPGFPSCREGANYVLNQYLYADYLFGQARFGARGGRFQTYGGLSLNVNMHDRFIITSRQAGAWQDTQRWVTNIGAGARLGALLGRLKLDFSFNIAGKDFQPYAGFGISYSVFRR
ncbi:MAG: hypothetical protein HRU41_28595 [Saprospiraceae bacterium]|nr:hypothetical protein [Saprospiraceae bacterium]